MDLWKELMLYWHYDKATAGISKNILKRKSVTFIKAALSLSCSCPTDTS